MSGENVIARAYQFAALLLSPIIFVVGLILIPVIHEVLVEIVQDISTGNTMDSILVWFVHLLALGMFCGLVAFCYFFVKHKGWGLFE